jgi:LAGLIDADG DNA endonuclease family
LRKLNKQGEKMTYQNGPTLNENQKQILYGSILGGSSIIRPERGKNCYLAMRDNDHLWLSYKIEYLKDFFKLDRNTIKKDKNTYRCYSVAYPVFNEVYNLFYKNEVKTITPEILEILTDEAWMIWFVDCGRKSKRKIYLRTNKFGEEGTKLIANYFNSLDCSCEIHQSRERYELVFNNKGAYEFMSIVAPKLPEFLIKKYD